MCTVILTSLFTIAAETNQYQAEVLSVKNDSHVYAYIEYVCSGYLYLDYVIRIIFCPKLRYFFYDMINITDGLAVLSSIAKTVAEGVLVLNEDYQSWLEVIDILQLLRILRLLRPMSKVTGFRLIYFTLKCSFRELLLVFMLLIFLTIVFSSLLYYLGDRESIASIPHGMWFSLITMTTVGYGDIVPKTVSVSLLLIDSLLAD